MQFKDVIGQRETQHHLLDMVEQNRLSHALLFLGKEGRGNLSMALAFAQYIVCDKVQHRQKSVEASPSLFSFDEAQMVNLPIGQPGGKQQTDSCGECPSCIKAANYAHPDIHFSYPVIPKKSGDKPISTDYITEWREFSKLYPYGNAFDVLQFIGAENK